VISGFSPVIGMYGGDEVNPLKDYLSSLALMDHYPSAVALPGHGDVILHFRQRVKEIADRHHDRLRQVLASIRHEEKTADQICRETYGQPSGSQYVVSLMTAISRLIYLESIGKARKAVKNGVFFYRALDVDDETKP